MLVLLVLLVLIAIYAGPVPVRCWSLLVLRPISFWRAWDPSPA